MLATFVLAALMMLTIIISAYCAVFNSKWGNPIDRFYTQASVVVMTGLFACCAILAMSRMLISWMGVFGGRGMTILLVLLSVIVTVGAGTAANRFGQWLHRFVAVNRLIASVGKAAAEVRSDVDMSDDDADNQWRG